MCNSDKNDLEIRKRQNVFTWKAMRFLSELFALLISPFKIEANMKTKLININGLMLKMGKNLMTSVLRKCIGFLDWPLHSQIDKRTVFGIRNVWTQFLWQLLFGQKTNKLTENCFLFQPLNGFKTFNVCITSGW